MVFGLCIYWRVNAIVGSDYWVASQSMGTSENRSPGEALLPVCLVWSLVSDNEVGGTMVVARLCLKSEKLINVH